MPLELCPSLINYYLLSRVIEKTRNDQSLQDPHLSYLDNYGTWPSNLDGELHATDLQTTDDVLGLMRCCSALPTDGRIGEFITEAPLLRSDKLDGEQPSMWHTSRTKRGPRKASCRIGAAANEERGNMTKGAG